MKTVKAVELVRKIRDQNYRETRNLSIGEQIRIIRKKAASFAKRTKQAATSV